MQSKLEQLSRENQQLKEQNKLLSEELKQTRDLKDYFIDQKLKLDAEQKQLEKKVKTHSLTVNRLYKENQGLYRQIKALNENADLIRLIDRLYKYKRIAKLIKEVNRSL